MSNKETFITGFLTADETEVLEKYRRAKSLAYATLEVKVVYHIQDGLLVHVNLTEKSKPMIVPAFDNLRPDTPV